MPSYNYQCSQCGYQFELRLSMADNSQPETQPCPECGVHQVKQIIVSIPPLADPYRMGRIKPDQQWRDYLKDIKSKNPGCADFNTF